MARQLSKSQVNHLRRLLAWVRCEIPPPPEEIKTIVRGIVPQFDGISDEGKARLVEWHREATSVPLYIRAALKSLQPVVADIDGEIVDAESQRQRMLGTMPTSKEAK